MIALPVALGALAALAVILPIDITDRVLARAGWHADEVAADEDLVDLAAAVLASLRADAERSLW